MDSQQIKHRDNFLLALSNYSECLRPYLRQVQEKYVAAYHIAENDPVALSSYCSNERKVASEARKVLEAYQPQGE